MPTILVIDNDPVFQTDLIAALPKAGHTVMSAVDGRSGLHMLHPPAPSLAIVGLDLPGGDGLETVLELRRLEPSLPIIAVSAEDNEDGARRLQMAPYFGADEALVKPVMPPDLFRTIDQLLLSR